MEKASQLETIFRLILIVAMLSLSEIGGAQSNEFDKGGFVLSKDQEGKIVEATYNHPAALRNQFRSGKILSSDIVSADKFKNPSTFEELYLPHGMYEKRHIIQIKRGYNQKPGRNNRTDN